ncbi:MAG TPA: hypothetical protein VKM55_06395 [Candidatus Lokiarchaeia archaeon]|nr:hypothetical protein [Candidatus Lokiarchaeia archaeon]
MSRKTGTLNQIQRCSVKNCQKELVDEDQVVHIRDRVFCKTCAVIYFTGMIGETGNPRE